MNRRKLKKDKRYKKLNKEDSELVSGLRKHRSRFTEQRMTNH